MVSGIQCHVSLRNCPCIALSFYFLNPSSVHLFLNSFLLTVSTVSVIPTVFAPTKGTTPSCSSHSLYNSRNLSVHAHRSPDMQSINISFGGSAPLIVIIFLVALSSDLTSSFDHPMIPAPYLITATAQVLIADILFLPFNFVLKASFNLLALPCLVIETW